MHLIIVRHGIAEERDADGVTSDADRALTPRGIKRTREAARGLRVLGCRPGRVATSPLRRARQTARVLADVLAPKAPLEVCDFLAPGGQVSDFTAWLRGLKDEVVMIVGHMPDVADAASMLLSKRLDIDMVFKKSAACCLSFEGPPHEGSGWLEWLLQPRQLRALGESDKGKS